MSHDRHTHFAVSCGFMLVSPSAIGGRATCQPPGRTVYTACGVACARQRDMSNPPRRRYAKYHRLLTESGTAGRPYLAADRIRNGGRDLRRGGRGANCTHALLTLLTRRRPLRCLAAPPRPPRRHRPHPTRSLCPTRQHRHSAPISSGQHPGPPLPRSPPRSPPLSPPPCEPPSVRGLRGAALPLPPPRVPLQQPVAVAYLSNLNVVPFFKLGEQP